MKNTQRFAALGAFAVLSATMVGCSNGQEASDSQESSSAAPSSSGSSSAAPSSGSQQAGDGVTTADDVFGPACGDLPQGDEDGSLQSMGPQPVATAASTNPLLTSLTAAVQATELQGTLNDLEKATVFAPADPAFDKLGSEKVTQLLDSPDTLAPILQHHVVGDMRYDAEGLTEAGSVETLNGEVAVEGEGENMTIGGAKVLCGNIPTSNATVFVIDTVLQPGSGSGGSGSSEPSGASGTPAPSGSSENG